MKIEEQSLSFGFITLLLLILIFILDLSFYRFPTVIKLFAYERELLVGIALFTQFQAIRSYTRRFSWLPLGHLRLLGLSLLLTAFGIVLLYLLFKPYLLLWDDNPFLAANPVIWNLFMPLITFGMLTALYIQLLCTFGLLFTGANRSPIESAVVIGSIVLAAVGLNLIENRYAFQPIVVWTPFIRRYGWTYFVLFAIILLVNTRRWAWLGQLSARQKYITAILTPFLLLLVGALYSSRLLHPLCAYSVTAKGLVLAGSSWVGLFGLVLWIKTLWQLPGAALTERLQQQTIAIQTLQKMTASTFSMDQRVIQLLQSLQAVTRSSLGWIEMRKSLYPDQTRVLFYPDQPLSIQETIGALRLGEHFEASPEGPFQIVSNLDRESHLAPLRLINPRWRSLLWIDLTPYWNLDARLCLLKTRRRGFTFEHWQILEVILMKTAPINTV